jgi:Tfp pilus assembly protein PilN
MFEIDLLHGKGRPRRVNLKRAAMRVVMLLIPVGATVAFAADLQRGRLQTEALQQTAAEVEAQLIDYADDVRVLTELRGQLSDLFTSLEEIGYLLRYRLVASTALAQIAETLPPDIVLREIQFRRNGRRERIEDEDTGKVRYEPVVNRTLRLSLYGFEGTDTDTAVQTFLDRLTHSPALAPLVRDIRTTSRQQRELNETKAMFYEIELLLKEQR